MKFYIVGLTKQEILQGKKTAITEAVCNEFHQCIAAMHKSEFTPLDKKQAEIFYENDFTNENFAKQFHLFEDVLYINEVAKKILDKRRIVLRVQGEVTNVPKHTGLVQSISVYSK